MIKHIVMWRFKESAQGLSREENVRRVKAALEDLVAKIPEVVRLEVGANAKPGEGAADLVLYSEFRDWAALDRYSAHPEHVAVAGLLKELREERRVVDYEVD